MSNVIAHLADVGAELKFTRGKNNSLCIHTRRIVEGAPLESFIHVEEDLIRSKGPEHDAFILGELSAYLNAMDEVAKAGPPENLKA